MSVEVAVQASDALIALIGSLRPSAFAATERAVEATCFVCGAAAAQISITWLTDDEIARMNREYLDHRGETDVISFHLYEYGDDPVGDIYIGFEQAGRQASEFGATHNDELVRLAVHGTLHVLGFDHPGGLKRLDSEMWTLQEAIVSEVLTGKRLKP